MLTYWIHPTLLVGNVSVDIVRYATPAKNYPYLKMPILILQAMAGFVISLTGIMVTNAF